MGITQSGESKDVLETVRRSRELGANTLALTNDESFSMAEAAEFHVFLRAGKEESVAATKTYTAELLVLYLLVEALKGADILSKEARNIPDQAREILKHE